MKKPHHVDMARDIGSDAWALLCFDSLPVSASVEEQIAALRADQAWIWDHCSAVSREISDLIESIQEGGVENVAPDR